MTWSLRLFQTTPGDFYTTAYKSWVQRWWLYLIYLGNTFDHHCDWQFPFEWKGCQQLWLSFLLLFNQDIYNLLLLWMSCLSPRLLETCHHLDSLPLPLSSLGRWLVVRQGPHLTLKSSKWVGEPTCCKGNQTSGGRQHCRLSICEYWFSWTNTASEQKILITILTLKRGPCLMGGRREKAFSS